MSHGSTSIDEASRGDEGSRQGRLLRELIQSGHPFSGRERHCCFLNTAGPRFANVSRSSGLDLAEDGRAVSMVDWDHDGDLDCWIVNRSGPQVRFLRNDLPRTNHFVAIRLEGVESNRDAIGARVELVLGNDSNQRTIRTVRAGSGYLSQSSKWVHFGLGKNSCIERVTIRWPSGNIQHFDGLEANRHYHIVENQIEAQPWERPLGKVRLFARPAPVPQLRKNNRIVLGSPIALPQLSYRHRDGTADSLVNSLGNHRPFLLTLWASWCQPCVAELQEMAYRSDQLKERGLRVLALNVDGLTATAANTKVAKDVVQRLSSNFTFGEATEELVNRLQMIDSRLFDLDTVLPLPCSFLIDASDRLAAIYKGTVDVQQLVMDVEQLNVSPARRRQLAMVFPGRWSASPQKHRLLYVALDLVRVGPLQDALDYIRQHETELSSDYQYHTLLYNLGQQYTKLAQHDQAASLYRRTLQLVPEFASASYNLGVTHLLKGNFSQAETRFRQSLKQQPNDVNTLFGLGRCFARLGKLPEAITHFRRAVEIERGHAECQFELAVSLALMGQIKEATIRYRKSIALDAKFLSEVPQKKFVAAAHLAADTFERQGPAQSAQSRNIRRQIHELLAELNSAP